MCFKQYNNGGFKLAIWLVFNVVSHLKENWLTNKFRGEDWNFYWVNREWMLQNFDRHKFKEGQLVCHFRNDYELTRKDSIIKNHKKAKKLPENQNKWEFLRKSLWLCKKFRMDYLPPSYVLPMEYHLFVEEYRKYPPDTIWIMKPVEKKFKMKMHIWIFRFLEHKAEASFCSKNSKT